MCDAGAAESTQLQAPICTTCAAVQLVAAPLLSTYFLNEWPAHMLNKHEAWAHTSGDQCSARPLFVVRQVCYLGGKIFITFIKKSERVVLSL